MYKIDRGDNLWNIEKKLGIEHGKLYELNKDRFNWDKKEDADKVWEGQVLSLPEGFQVPDGYGKEKNNSDNGGQNTNGQTNEFSLLKPTDLIGPGLVLTGQPFIPKNSSFAKALYPRSAKVLGARSNTSLASLVTRRIGLGGLAGRAVPIIGWVWTAKDILEMRVEYEIETQFGGDREAYRQNLERVLKEDRKYPYGCFLAGTEVFTGKGMKNIENISKGDSVYSYNLTKGEVELQLVVKVMKRNVEGIYEINVGGEIIFATAEHPFYVQGKEWVKVKDLQIGDNLITTNGAILSLTGIKRLDGVNTVYNMTVDGNHNYFVGKAKILVHNK
ncbi:MAG: polymorphic toxin-type HINT domain-containing protein [Cytophagaceae bacterium]